MKPGIDCVRPIAGGKKLPALAADRERMCPDSGDVVRGRYGRPGEADQGGDIGDVGSADCRMGGFR